MNTSIRIDYPTVNPLFLARVAVPIHSEDEAKAEWSIAGRYVQKDVMTRDADGVPNLIMASAMVPSGTPLDLLIGGARVERPRAQVRPNIEDLSLLLDVGQNEGFYVCNPIKNRETFRYMREDGPLIRTEAHFSRFQRGTDRVLTVWAFLTYSADGVVKITIDVSNAAASGCPSGVVGVDGPVYFNAIKIQVPFGSDVICEQERPSVDLVNGYLVKPRDDGKDHSIFPRENFHRRLAIHETGNTQARNTAARSLAWKNFGFAEGGNSYYLGGYGPTRVALPVVPRGYSAGGLRGLSAARIRKAGEVAQVRRIISTGLKEGGAQGFESNAMGWAHPLGSNIGYNPGGSGIEPFPAPFQICEEVQLASLLMAAHAEREPIYALDAETGEPLGQFDFSNQDGTPMEFLVADTGAPQLQIPGFDRIPSPPKSFNSPSPGRGDAQGQGYRPALSGYAFEDAQHGVRNTYNAKALFYYTNDAAAEFRLRVWAEHHILARTDQPHRSWAWHPTKLVSNFERLPWVHRNPGRGGVTGSRDHAWIAEITAMYYSIASPEWRKKYRSWFKAEGEILALGCMKNGIGTLNAPNSHVHRTAKLAANSTVDDSVAVHQSFEVGLFAHGVYAHLVSFMKTSDQPNNPIALAAMRAIIHSARLLHFSQISPEPTAWDLHPKKMGPPWYIEVFDYETNTPSMIPSPRALKRAGGPELWHGHFHLLYAYLATRAFGDGGDLQLLQKAFDLVGGPGGRDETPSLPDVIREGAWYAEEVAKEASGWEFLLFGHAAPMIACLQNRLDPPA